jgi:hypothetical protein
MTPLLPELAAVPVDAVLDGELIERSSRRHPLKGLPLTPHLSGGHPTVSAAIPAPPWADRPIFRYDEH